MSTNKNFQIVNLVKYFNRISQASSPERTDDFGHREHSTVGRHVAYFRRRAVTVGGVVLLEIY